jgi:perosamine synthetase
MTDVATPATRPQVPLARPDVGPLEEALVLEVLRSGTLALGPFAEELEAGIAALAGRRHGVAVSSGTTGLHAALAALGIGPGDEVITTPFSFVASANCIVYQGARPVFVDIEEETLGIDPSAVESAITPATRGLLPVDVFGHPCRLPELDDLARRHRLSLVEDACEALGSSIDGRPAGSFGEVAAFAFYPNKQLTTGEGGMLVTDDDDLAETLRSLRNQGRDADGTWLRHVRLGYNYRLDEMSAALGVAQLRRRAELVAGRARVVAAYEARLHDAEWLRLPTVAHGAGVDWFVYVIRLAARVDRDRLIDQLAEAGIPSRPYFSPIHLQPIYRERFGFSPGDFPITERVAATTLALPFASSLTDDDVDRVADALHAAMRQQGAA